MPTISIPIERLLFGNDHWRSHRAVAELEIYCDLLQKLQDRIDSLDTRGRDEEASLFSAQAVINGYAFEIAMKSLWALDDPVDPVPHTHCLPRIFDGLNEKTATSLKGLQITRQVLEAWPTPFLTSRYSMENSSRDIVVYEIRVLRSLVELLEEKLKDARESLMRSPQPPTD